MFAQIAQHAIRFQILFEVHRDEGTMHLFEFPQHSARRGHLRKQRSHLQLFASPPKLRMRRTGALGRAKECPP